MKKIEARLEELIKETRTTLSLLDIDIKKQEGKRDEEKIEQAMNCMYEAWENIRRAYDMYITKLYETHYTKFLALSREIDQKIEELKNTK